MFDDNKKCLLIGFVLDVVYLVALFFLVKLAKDDGIFILVTIVVALALMAVIGRAAKGLFADGGFLTKIAGGIMIAIAVVGTLVVLWFALIGGVEPLVASLIA